jgi:hypothetical protein
LIFLVLLLFSWVSVYAVTYIDYVDTLDSCSNHISFKVERTLSNVSGECGLVKCEVTITPQNGSGQYIEEYDNMVWDNGQAIAEIYDFNQPVYFFYQYNGIYGIDFSIDIVTYCGTLHYVFTPPKYENVINVLGCSENNCTSSFNYCEFYLDTLLVPDDWDDQMPMLDSVSYLDPVSGMQTLNATNSFGIFHFPYYGHDAVDCDFHPNLFDFVNDMNEYLIQSGIGGNCEFYYTNQQFYCKRYIRYLNTGVFFIEMDITDRNFKHFIGTIPVCDFPGGFINKSVNISSDFSISMDCLPGNLLNSDSDIDEILNGFQKNNYEITLENDLGIDLNIHCYPSITDSDIFIENKMGNKYKVDIYSLSGQLKEEFDFERTYIKVDISAYNSGLYFISFHDLKTGKKKIEKIIKQ